MALVNVAVETPQHSAVGGLLSYQSEQTLPPGTLVSVPLGPRQLPGIVWHGPAAVVAAGQLRDVTQVLASLPPLPPVGSIR